MVLADTATTVTAIFAAVAAVAAWATVMTDWLRQRAARQPNVSAGFQDIQATDRSRIEFENMGPGLAIQLAYLLVAGGLRQNGIVGGGHLRAGERQAVDVGIDVPGRRADFVWVCRDIDQRLHVWSYSGAHKRLKRGRYLSLGDCFRLMYPQVPLPPRNVGVAEQSTAPDA
jgi:hypothetical protein